MKYLLIGAALAALSFSSSAWAGAAAVPMLMTGPAIACDYGPPYKGTVPAAAQAAGFTHCAANYDFTSTSNFTNNGHTYNFSDTSTWLDCKGATNPLWSFGYGNCAHISMITDGGVQVLDLQWQTSDYSTSATSTAIQTSGPNNPSDLTGAILTLPAGKYIEYTDKVPSNTYNNACNASCFLGAIWSWGGSSDSNFIEWDFMEHYYQGVNSDGMQLHPTNGATGGVDAIGEPHNVSGYTPTQYNTFGMRTAVDTGGDLAMCTYLNGSLINGGGASPCGTGSYSPAPLGRDFLVADIGPQGSNANYLTTGDEYIKRITVWECSGYASGECYSSSGTVTSGGALTGSP